MAGWFDEHAKKSARPTTAGVSRRRIVVGGSAAVAAGWTAPMLMASSAAAVGASTCPAGSTYCTNGNFDTAQCCPAGAPCLPTGGFNGIPSCQGTVGGVCGNSGSGRGGCTLSHCNGNANQPDGCNACSQSNICGGESANCAGDEECASSPTLTLVCTATHSSTTQKYCRRPCTTDANCSNSLPGRVQYCRDSFCVSRCNANNECQPTGVCQNPGTTNSYCLYTANA